MEATYLFDGRGRLMQRYAGSPLDVRAWRVKSNNSMHGSRRRRTRSEQTAARTDEFGKEENEVFVWSNGEGRLVIAAHALRQRAFVAFVLALPACGQSAYSPGGESSENIASSSSALTITDPGDSASGAAAAGCRSAHVGAGRTGPGLAKRHVVGRPNWPLNGFIDTAPERACADVWNPDGRRRNAGWALFDVYLPKTSECEPPDLVSGRSGQ